MLASLIWAIDYVTETYYFVVVLMSLLLLVEQSIVIITMLEELGCWISMLIALSFWNAEEKKCGLVLSVG